MALARSMLSSAPCISATAFRSRSCSSRVSSATSLRIANWCLCRTAAPMPRPAFSRAPSESHRGKSEALHWHQFVAADQVAAGDQFGQNHRHRLQSLDFLVRYTVARLVLDGEHAYHPAASRIGTPISEW